MTQHYIKHMVYNSILQLKKQNRTIYILPAFLWQLKLTAAHSPAASILANELVSSSRLCQGKKLKNNKTQCKKGLPCTLLLSHNGFFME